MSERAATASFVEALAKLEELQKAQRERDEYKKLYTHLREENERLKRGLLGKKAEKLPQNDAQLSLAILGLMLGGGEEPAPAPAEEEETQVIPEHTRKVPKRRGPSDDWPRVYIELVPPEVEREGLEAFDVIGQESRGVLERRPASCVFVEVVRKKFVRKADKGATETSVLIADPLALPIAKGIAGPGLLAETVVKRWCDHQPLHRQESIFARDGLELARSTLSEWHMALALLAAPLIQAMKMDAFQAPYLCTDATGVLVQASERCKNGHFWVLVAPEKHVLFEFSQKHDSDATAKLLEGYKGYLVADAHVVYDHLYRGGQIIEVGCWSHTRRYFFYALASDPDRAKVALAYMTALFKLERTIADEPRKKKEAVRDKKSRPIVQDFFNWCEAERDLVLDDSPIAAAIGYAINQRKALERFLDDGRLPMTNNISERNLRKEAVGRKNWIFVGSEDGATANTTFVSLIASCELHGLEPWRYLRDLFYLLPEWPKSRVLELAPAYFQQTLQQEEAKRRLAENPLRRALLAFAR
ncbi:MAG TPA: IS66 family transposase [Polyangiaceae bacterium]|nr:IS66 family transposase [Polyangiaceae bacterium]